MADDQIEQAIVRNATGPQSAQADGVEVRQHSIADQIEADKYLASRKVAANPAKAFSRAKIVPPGTV